MICLICEKEFKTNSLLSRHISKEHDILKNEYYDKYLKKNNEGICLKCGNKTRFNNIILGYYNYCSITCAQNSEKTKNKRENTILEKYGVKNIRNTEYYEKISRQTKLERYGDENYNNREKAKETCIKKYSVENPIQNKEIERKRNKTNMYLYGSDNYKKNLILKYNNEKYRNLEKAKKTCLKKYNVENPFQSKEIKEKIKKINILKYGVDNPLKSEIIKEKMKKTNLERYNCEYPQQNTEIRRKQQYKYFYDNKNFDSSWEIAYYIWLKDNNIDFEYQPNISFDYVYKGEKHRYFPDFKVGDKYIELKGAQFFNENRMINPYDRRQDDLYEAKHQCMIDNNVKILNYEDIKPYINYVNEKYEKDYLKQFKNRFMNTEIQKDVKKLINRLPDVIAAKRRMTAHIREHGSLKSFNDECIKFTKPL